MTGLPIRVNSIGGPIQLDGANLDIKRRFRFSLGGSSRAATTSFLMRLGVVSSVRVKRVVVFEFDFIDFPSIEFDQSEADHGLATGSRLFSPGAVVWFFDRLETFAVAAQDGAAFLLAVTLCPRGFDPDRET